MHPTQHSTTHHIDTQTLPPLFLYHPPEITSLTTPPPPSSPPRTPLAAAPHHSPPYPLPSEHVQPEPWRVHRRGQTETAAETHPPPHPHPYPWQCFPPSWQQPPPQQQPSNPLQSPYPRLHQGWAGPSSAGCQSRRCRRAGRGGRQRCPRRLPGQGCSRRCRFARAGWWRRRWVTCGGWKRCLGRRSARA